MCLPRGVRMSRFTLRFTGKLENEKKNSKENVKISHASYIFLKQKHMAPRYGNIPNENSCNLFKECRVRLRWLERTIFTLLSNDDDTWNTRSRHPDVIKRVGKSMVSIEIFADHYTDHVTWMVRWTVEKDGHAIASFTGEFIEDRHPKVAKCSHCVRVGYKNTPYWEKYE